MVAESSCDISESDAAPYDDVGRRSVSHFDFEISHELLGTRNYRRRDTIAKFFEN